MKLHRLLWLAALASLAYADPAAAQTRFIAFSGGATYGDLCCGAVNSDHRWGGTAGLMVGMRNWNYAVFTLEGNWVQKGGGTTRVDYIDVPFLIGGTYGSHSGGIRARVYTGIGIAIPISCSTESLLVNCDRKKSPEWTWPFGVQVGKWSPSGLLVAVDARY